ncbi:hypothetical protein [Streptomyces sp. NPDC001843]|uniref:hypothetical protein n=1 Tax=Streptomyces sp. NPDC001843 TaxID=3364617 RepID=UPI0036B54728
MCADPARLWAHQDGRVRAVALFAGRSPPERAAHMCTFRRSRGTAPRRLPSTQLVRPETGLAAALVRAGRAAGSSPASVDAREAIAEPGTVEGPLERTVTARPP